MWRAGDPVAHIASQLGWKPKSLQAHISTLRAEGYDLPYRRDISPRALEVWRAKGREAAATWLHDASAKGGRASRPAKKPKPDEPPDRPRSLLEQLAYTGLR